MVLKEEGKQRLIFTVKRLKLTYYGVIHMENTMPKDLSEFERYLIERLDRIEEKVTDVRIKVASIAVIISLVTAVITTVVTTTIEKSINKSVYKVQQSM